MSTRDQDAHYLSQQAAHFEQAAKAAEKRAEAAEAKLAEWPPADLLAAVAHLYVWATPLDRYRARATLVKYKLLEEAK